MRIPFFSRFVTKRNPFFTDMEDITDKALREFLRNPLEQLEDISDSIYADEQRTQLVLETISDTLPIFKKTAAAIYQEADDCCIAQECGVIPEYMQTLKEIMKRQQLDEIMD